MALLVVVPLNPGMGGAAQGNGPACGCLVLSRAGSVSRSHCFCWETGVGPSYASAVGPAGSVRQAASCNPLAAAAGPAVPLLLCATSVWALLRGLDWGWTGRPTTTQSRHSLLQVGAAPIARLELGIRPPCIPIYIGFNAGPPPVRRRKRRKRHVWHKLFLKKV